jgi:hypothetical protein
MLKDGVKARPHTAKLAEKFFDYWGIPESHHQAAREQWVAWAATRGVTPQSSKASTPTGSEAPKKRGRPKKSESQPSAASVASASPIAEEAPKKRGRPKKSESIGAAATLAAAPAAAAAAAKCSERLLSTERLAMLQKYQTPGDATMETQQIKMLFHVWKITPEQAPMALFEWVSYSNSMKEKSTPTPAAAAPTTEDDSDSDSDSESEDGEERDLELDLE